MEIIDKNIFTQMIKLGIDHHDVIEKFVRSSGKGGQNVNKVSTCVYLKHIPTGIQVKSSLRKSQAENRKTAWTLLIQKLEELRNNLILNRINKIEKIKRQTRLRPTALKEHILENKKLNSAKKQLRKKISFEE